MSVRVCVILFAVLIGLASAAKLKQPVAEKKGECVDNTLYAKYVCNDKKDGEKLLVPGSCSDYYECSKGESKKVTCSKFFDPITKKCVKTSDCVEVDNTNCVISTPPPCGVTPSPPTPKPTPKPTPTPTPCECPTPPAPITCPPISCPTAPTCPPPTECPAPIECPEPPTCPTPEPEPPTPKPPTPKPPTPKPPTPKPPCGTPGPCNSYYNPDDLYGTYACKKQKDGSMMIVPTNCSQYLYCIDGWSYLKDCGSELYFNSLVGACDQKRNVHCPSG